WEIMGHNWTNSRSINGMTEAEEREVIDGTLKRITQDTGYRLRPRGWLGTGLAESSRTLDILAEHGIEYVGDWVNDEQPYILQTASKPIVAMPYSIEINDIGIFMRRGFTGPDYQEMLRDQFDVLYEESAKTAKIMCIALHPFITGVPFRAKHLEAALTYMRRHEHAWFATGVDILSAWREATGGETAEL
ncbi:MAG TPA: polysaccharide deacetylase, partial [Chloroflexota bacterium]